MKPWTEWIINVKISFSNESNKLPMICLSERLVAWIRETPGSCGALISPPWVIESCTVLTLWSWWLREPEPDRSPESGSSGSATGPQNKPILCDLCPGNRVTANPQLSNLEALISIYLEQWMLRANERLAVLFFSFTLFCFICCLPLTLLHLFLAFRVNKSRLPKDTSSTLNILKCWAHKNLLLLDSFPPAKS